MSQMIRWSVGVALVLTTAGSALAAKQHIAAVRTAAIAVAHASVPAPSEPEYFTQAKGDLN